MAKHPASLSRFHLTTLLAIPVFFAIGFCLQGELRLWVFTGFWTVYLTIIGLGVSFIQLRFFAAAICRGDTGARRVALTFDDGPDPDMTPTLLDLLARERIPAAFFCIGKRVAAHPELVRRMVSEGHLVANHTFNHHWWTPLLGRRELLVELSKTQAAIEAAGGIRPAFMRPPVGLTNPNYPRVLGRLGLKLVGWSVRSMDTRWPVERVIRQVLNRADAGGIILLHDGNSSAHRIEQIVLPIIQGLRERGFEFARLDRLVADE